MREVKRERDGWGQGSGGVERKCSEEADLVASCVVVWRIRVEMRTGWVGWVGV